MLIMACSMVRDQRDIKGGGIFTQETKQEKLESVLLSQLHIKLPAKFKLDEMASRLVALPGLASEHLFQNGGCRCRILCFFGD